MFETKLISTEDRVITYIEMDYETFEEIWSKIMTFKNLENLVDEQGEEVKIQDLVAIRASGRIPYISRNEDNDWFFEKFNILTHVATGEVKTEPEMPKKKEEVAE